MTSGRYPWEEEIPEDELPAFAAALDSGSFAPSVSRAIAGRGSDLSGAQTELSGLESARTQALGEIGTTPQLSSGEALATALSAILPMLIGAGIAGRKGLAVGADSGGAGSLLGLKGMSADAKERQATSKLAYGDLTKRVASKEGEIKTIKDSIRDNEFTSGQTDKTIGAADRRAAEREANITARYNEGKSWGNPLIDSGLAKPESERTPEETQAIHSNPKAYAAMMSGRREDRADKSLDIQEKFQATSLALKEKMSTQGLNAVADEGMRAQTEKLTGVTLRPGATFRELDGAMALKGTQLRSDGIDLGTKRLEISKDSLDLRGKQYDASQQGTNAKTIPEEARQTVSNAMTAEKTLIPLVDKVTQLTRAMPTGNKYVDITYSKFMNMIPGTEVNLINDWLQKISMEQAVATLKAAGLSDTDASIFRNFFGLKAGAINGELMERIASTMGRVRANAASSLRTTMSQPQFKVSGEALAREYLSALPERERDDIQDDLFGSREQAPQGGGIMTPQQKARLVELRQKLGRKPQ